MIVARLCLGICMAAKKFPIDQLTPVAHSFPILKDMRGFEQSIRMAFDTSILYWNRKILRFYLEGIYQIPVQASKLVFTLGAFEFGASSLQAARHDQPQTLVIAISNNIDYELA